MNNREFNENKSQIDIRKIDEQKADGQLKYPPKAKNAFLLIYRCLVIIGIIVIILLLLFKPCNCNCNADADKSNQTTYFDSSVDDSATDKPSESESAVNDLNAQVEDGMITMSMNANPVFKDGTAKGDLLIENDKSNKHPQVIQIYRNDTNELIYTSGKLPVGSSINEDTLDEVLPPGKYECTAYFNAVDDTTGEKLGTSGANIRIHILN